MIVRRKIDPPNHANVAKLVNDISRYFVDRISLITEYAEADHE